MTRDITIAFYNWKSKDMEVKFFWLDYFLFILMLALSALIGVYYGLINKQKTAADYLFGNKQMSILPISMSLVSSSLSSVVLLAVPADVYSHGVTYSFIAVATTLAILGGYFIYIPVFYKLQTVSTYEYLGLRFGNRARLLASILFTISMLLYLPIVIYAPALALGRATGVSSRYLTPVICAVCIFYTALGGLKAVVWTDVLQCIIMLGSLFVVLITGIISIGGFGVFIERNRAGGRLDASFDIDPTERDTFWSVVFGTFFFWSNHMVIHQGFVQKCLSLPSFKAVRISLFLATIGIALIMLTTIFTGLVVFAKYFECDPAQSGLINRQDELVPFYVMEQSQSLPGLPGLFISGVFSAALSTLSASMNCLAATIYEDFISLFVPVSTTDKRIGLYFKLLVVFIGVLTTAGVYIVEQLGGLLALTVSFGGISNGPLLGLFTAGMLLPMVNEKGALSGAIVSFAVMFWIIMKAQWYQLTKTFIQPTLAVRTDGCNGNTSNGIDEMLAGVVQVLETSTTYSEPIEMPNPIYRVSIHWYTFMGLMIALVVSILVSFFTKASKPVKKDCISPLVHFLLKTKEEDPPNYDTVENALARVNEVELRNVE